MTCRLVSATLACLMIASAAAAQAPTTRELERINWMEFREVVPKRVDTVLVPLGTLEPHGVTANGADIIAPVAIARAIVASRTNAPIAPVIPHGITGSMDAYPGAFTVPEEVYRPYVKTVLLGLAKNHFKNIIMINGHGGPQTAVLNALGVEVGREAGVRTLVVNWWSYCSDITLEVFGEDGGHAGENENAFMLAIDPALVHKERYTGPNMTTANAAPERGAPIRRRASASTRKARVSRSSIRSRPSATSISSTRRWASWWKTPSEMEHDSVTLDRAGLSPRGWLESAAPAA